MNKTNRRIGAKTAAGILLIAALASAACFASEHRTDSLEIIYNKDLPGYGVNTIPMSANTWKSKTLNYPEPVADKDVVQVGPEFFQYEYGKPCVFNSDWIKAYGFYGGGTYAMKDGAMEIRGGKDGFYFGFGKHEKLSKDAKGIRYGSAWGPYPEAGVCLEMETEPGGKTTEWEYSSSGEKKKFEIGKSGKAIVELSNLRWTGDSNHPWILFKCLTPDANVKIKSLKLFPTGAFVSYKKEFELADKPVIARASYTISPTYKLQINGTLVDSGNNIYPSAYMKHIDIAPYLKKGANEIVFTKQFINWSMKRTSWLFEGCAADEAGNLTRILGDGTWQCALNLEKGGTWRSPALADGLQYITYKSMIDGKPVSNGLNPDQMGILTVSPFQRKFPVFDAGEQVACNASIPAGLNGKYSVKASVFSHEGAPVPVAENIAPAATGVANGLANMKFEFDAKKPGPYLVKWVVTDPQGGKVEESETEFVVVGPIAQDEIELKSFEEELTKRLELVQKIDCSKEVEIGDEFIGHAGMYNKAALIPGKAISQDGMKYRETGGAPFNYFAYRLHLKELGEPYLVEVVVPDNGDRQIYAGVAEQYPVEFSNNGVSPTGLQTRSPATGSCTTGGMYPLSKKPKTIRFVYYPNSLTAAVTVMNGRGKDRAAAIEVNVYRVRNGLPALKIPASTRMFGSHEERSLAPESLAAESVLEKSNEWRNEPHLYQWRNWYKMTERKIKWLRFSGRNMTSEGAYMYAFSEFPSRRHSPYWGKSDEGNLLGLALKMYRQNQIKCLLSVEYVSSPATGAEGIDDGLSDRKMAGGGKDSLFLVDRYGNQITASYRNGIDFLHPKMREVFLDVFRELYDHYKDIDCVEGIMLPTGVWFAPGFINVGSDLKNTEVGYGDLTVGLFEKETGIKLGVKPNDPNRFSKRYDLLMGPHQKAWLDWREKKLTECFQDISRVICASKNKWNLHIYPGELNNLATRSKDSVFLNPQATLAERNEFVGKFLKEVSQDTNITKKNPRINLISSAINSQNFQVYGNPDFVLAALGWNGNASTLSFLKNSCAGFFYHYGLDELDMPTTGAKRWIWSRGQRNAYDQRPAGDNTMKPFVDVIKTYTPQIVFYTWLDCNMETAHGEQTRRFSKALYETPELEFQVLPASDVQGIYAQSAKGANGVTYLRLVNNSPWPLSGNIAFDGTAYDAVYDRALEKTDKGFALNLLPADIRIIKLTGGNGPAKCDFAFEEAVRSELTGKAQAILASKVLAKIIPQPHLDQLAVAVKKSDAFLIYSALEDFEVKRCLEKYSFQSLERQGKLLADLEKTGSVFINCGAKEEYIDPAGNRWLPDQGYNGLAYGNEYAQFADRGDLPIEGTDRARVYQTEAGGQQVYYHIPLPDGTYDVSLHMAQTWPAGMSTAAPFSAKIGDTIKENICPARAGFAKATVEKMEGVSVTKGLMSIDLKGGVVINGIEIRKK